MVGLGRVELPTSPLSGVRSNQLSYRPVLERCHNLGARRLSQKTSFIVQKVSRTRLNVLDGYAVHDHRANGRPGKEGLIHAPITSRQEASYRVDSHLCPPDPIRIRSSPPSRKDIVTIRFSFRKEVIQPQVLLRLPCYDFTPIMNYTLGGCSLAVSAPTSSATHFRDVTGGVYKARERIHRGILIRDY
jgi:hypothetical protein